MKKLFGSINSKGFTSKIQSGIIPQNDHITYQGVFNQLSFQVGQRTQKNTDLHIGYCRSGNIHSIIDSNVNQYLALFVKGSSDGQQRDERNLNAVIVLDISGSMNSQLSKSSEKTRLQLSKQAISMFVSKLRPMDSFGLVIFNDKGQTLIPSTLRKNLVLQEIFQIINSLKVAGGTVLYSGFKQGEKNLKNFLSNSVKQIYCQNRIIILTDVCDNFSENEKRFIEDVASAQNINTTIIGISDDFRSKTCQILTQIKGFNYFCAVETQDLKKYLFENFDYTFFPSTYDIEIKIESDNIKKFEVFGTNDCRKVNIYNNNFQKINSLYTITKIKTSFPSELKIDNNIVHTYGGLILVKLFAKQQLENFKAKILLNYVTSKKVYEENIFDVNYNFPKNQQYFSQKCLEQAISGFYFVYEIKNIIMKINSDKDIKNNQTANLSYIQSLQKLKNIVPESRKKEVDSLINILKAHLH